MFIPFKNLAAGAKVWIYQADRKITPEDKAVINDKLREFTEQWQVHGAPLEASFEIRYDLFIVLAANDTASGCSIDSSVRVIKEIGSLTGIDFLSRNLIAFKSEEEIRLIDLSLLKSEFQLGGWNEESLVFNNALTTLGDVQERWLVPAGTTWLKRYIARPQSVQ